MNKIIKNVNKITRVDGNSSKFIPIGHSSDNQLYFLSKNSSYLTITLPYFEICQVKS